MKEQDVNKKGHSESRHARVNVIKAQTCLGKGGGVRPTAVTHRR